MESIYTIPEKSPPDKSRSFRPREVFALQCDACHSEIEIPTPPPHLCPLCHATLTIQWRGTL
jgi:hypothetical protein